MLCLMTRKLFSFAKQESMEENPDSLMFQEVLTPGQLYLMFLKVSSTWFVHLSVSSTAVSTHFHISDVLYSLYICSMVTHTRNSCSAFTHPRAHTHSSEHTHTHTHTMNTHTHREHTARAVGSQLSCGARGGVGGSVPCSRAPRRGIEGGESAGHSLPSPTIPARPRLELTTFRLGVRLSTIRPRLPICTSFKNLGSVIFFGKYLFYAHQACIYLIKKYSSILRYYYKFKITDFSFSTF